MESEPLCIEMFSKASLKNFIELPLAGSTSLLVPRAPLNDSLSRIEDLNVVL